MTGLTEMLHAIRDRAQSLQNPRGKRAWRVLIVDDDAAMRQFLEFVVRGAGYVTSSASNGVEAFTMFETGEPFDVLLTDLAMPQMNGDELARRIRYKHPAVKVLYVTGYSDRLFRDKPMLWNDEAFLEKPCTPTGLLEGLALLIDGRVSPPAVWK